MKSKIKILVILLALITSSVVFTKQASGQQPYVSFQVFYDQLSPYGQWVDYPNYGYVWIPDAGSDFVPYSTGGHWIITDYGFTWMSDYNWGWAPFHYGRWNYDNYYGWFWVPDNEWGPAWVSWRRADGYYGWEPMGPGISITMSFGRQYSSQNDHWIFVRDRDIDRSDVNHYYVNRNDHDRIVRNSTVINNTYFDSRRKINYVAGPARSDVQKATGRRVDPVSIKENDRPGQDMRNGQLRIYRPEVIKTNDRGQKPAPARITSKQDVKRPAERNVTNQPGNANPQNNTRREVQQNAVTPQNNNSKAVQQQNANPQNNTRREVQQNTVAPQNSNNNTKAVQQQNTNPTNNTRRDVQQNTVNPPNNNNTKAVQQQNANPPQNTKNVRQPAKVNSSDKKEAVQPEKSKTEQDNKKKN